MREPASQLRCDCAAEGGEVRQRQKSGEGAGRRGALAALARWGGMVALVLGGGWLIGRRSSSGGAASSAGNPCARCASIFSCLLPQAEASRRSGVGLVTPVRRPVDGAAVDPRDIGCAEGRELKRQGVDNG
jgi:hypothetical protein